MLQQLNETREQIKKDKLSVVESIHDVFDSLINEIEKRRKRMVIDT
jgi:hypothetical protein